MRRLLTLLLVAVATTAGSTWWLYDGDLAEAVDPVLDVRWDADNLAVQEGLVETP